MSRTDRIEDARKQLTWLMAERDSVAARNPVDLVRLRSLDAAIDAEIAGAVAAYEDVLSPIPAPPPPQLHWDHTVRVHTARRSPSPDTSMLERRARRVRWLLAGVVLIAFVGAAILLFAFWPTATTLEPAPLNDGVVRELPVAERIVAPPPPAIARAQTAAAPIPDAPEAAPEDPPPSNADAPVEPTPEATSVEPTPKAKKPKRKRRTRKRRRTRKSRKHRKGRKIEMGSSRDPLSGL